MLIRRCVAEDMPHLLEIWLQATLHAHDFLPAAAWWPRQEAMRLQLQQCQDIWVVEAQDEAVLAATLKGQVSARDPQVVGFMAIDGDELLALYLHPEWQQQGLGTTLIGLAQQYHPYLQLRVCVLNSEAVQFYRRHGFAISREFRQADSPCDEYLMEYRQP